MNCIGFKKRVVSVSKKKMLYEFVAKFKILFIFLKPQGAWDIGFSGEFRNISTKDIVPGTTGFGCFCVKNIIPGPMVFGQEKQCPKPWPQNNQQNRKNSRTIQKK